VPGCSQWLGPHDTRDSAAIRFDGHLRDGDGGIYWLLATVLPGFGAFRYPSKLLTLTCLAVALLAGSGWDRAVAGNKRRALVTCLACLAATLVLLAVVFVARTPIVDAMTSLIDTRAASIFGPTNPERAWLAMRGALLHASIVLGLGACLLWLAPLRPALAGALVLCLLSGDLTLANRSLVMTVPESMFAERPELIKLIEDAERADPAPGGLYRIHRLPSWEPTGWYRSRQPLHHDELVRWERKTIQPKYAIPYGIQYTLTEGVSELYDYMFFFAPFPGIYQDEALARRVLGPNSKDRVVAFPRRGFDLWNTRYFLLPYVAGNNEFRGIASFLPQTKAIAPAAVEGESDGERKRRLEAWSQEEDWQLLRNEEAYPRAWVVHEVKFWPPLQGMGRAVREPLMYEILYQDDPFWSVRGREVYDPRSLAWIETDAGSGLEGYVTRAPTVPSETPRIVDYTPDRVEIEVDLQTPGIVILADVYYPGWTLTIDGKPASIYRANRMMRGAAVLSGWHTLVYSYQPESFRYGVMASASALVVLLGIVVWSWRAPVDRRLSPDARPAGDHDGVARVEALS
jgi:hypothetical protein